MENFDYYDEDGNHIEGTSDGWLFVNGECVSEPGTDADFDRYAVDVANGNGYYNEDGAFVRTGCGD